MRMRMIGLAALGVTCLSLLLAHSSSACAWGDEGHEVVGLIADHYLEPTVRTRVKNMLAGDSSHLTKKDIAHEATWADKYRDSDRATTKKHYNQTHDWHFVDLELHGPDLSVACFGRPPVPAGTVASKGPPQDCVVDKINEFAAELGNPAINANERRTALQFLLHFVGDLHQPLHASDDHDKGGNEKRVSAQGIAANNLHHYWDTEFVRKIGTNEKQVAKKLIAKISDADRAKWSEGKADDWAMESFEISKAHTYSMLPSPTSPDHYKLPQAYVTDATRVAGDQLSKAGVRLAFVLNEALK